MTTLRRQRIGLLASRGLGPLGLILCLVMALAPYGRAEVTERVVTDPRTGLAISGFDPVAYFTDGKPSLGRADFEYRAEGVVWRFRNDANRAAFAGAIHVYRPRFGGYDPVAVGRGVATAGHPEIWAISGARLYLFYDEQARSTFLRNPDEVIRIADQRWVEVLGTLVP